MIPKLLLGAPDSIVVKPCPLTIDECEDVTSCGEVVCEVQCGGEFGGLALSVYPKFYPIIGTDSKGGLIIVFEEIA